MAIANTVIPNITTADTFSGWLAMTNELANAMSSVVLTASAANNVYGGANAISTTGSVVHNGSITANTFITSALGGIGSVITVNGTNLQLATGTLLTPVAITSGTVSSNAVNCSGLVSGANLSLSGAANIGGELIVAANVAIGSDAAPATILLDGDLQSSASDKQIGITATVLSFDGATTLSNTEIVVPSANVSGDATVGGTLTSADQIVTGALVVDGPTNVANVSLANGATLTTGLLASATGLITSSANVAVGNSIISAAAVSTGTLTATAGANVAGTVATAGLQVSGAATFGSGLSSAGGVVIGSNSAHANLMVYGTITGTDNVAGYQSDKRLKSNARSINPDVLRFVTDELAAVEFDWNELAESKGHSFGVIAQQAREHLPDLVREGYDGYLRFDYIKLVPILLAIIQSLERRIEHLETKL